MAAEPQTGFQWAQTSRGEGRQRWQRRVRDIRVVLAGPFRPVLSPSFQVIHGHHDHDAPLSVRDPARVLAQRELLRRLLLSFYVQQVHG